ncbi:MAG: peptidase M1 [Nitrospirales bacterium]|nr:MAG: peptidase M1 [Nitrospirales bacterium]
MLLGLCFGLAFEKAAWGIPPMIPHHNLTMTIQPANHSLIVEDTITFPNASDFPDMLELTLNNNLIIDEILVNNSVLQLQGITQTPQSPDQEREHRLRIPLVDSKTKASSPTIKVRYHGMIADHPRGAPGLRFTKPDETTGYIGPEGVYLTSETQWYPTIPHTLATFQVNATVPSGWETVTQGKETAHAVAEDGTTSTWSIPNTSEALTLVANRFVKQETVWKGITVATYLFPEDAQLADQYLESTIQYLDMYTTLLGPYPFSKFAVVENFFPAGIGLPSYTLLGNRIIKRGYTQPYSLGHEIVHSWFGNSVFNHFSKGNWVEGLTTYLSNYYYEEVHASADTARKKRQQMFFEYNLYGTPPHEYPVRQFHHKETRIDNAIGYQKTAMLFHMLRQEVGDAAFFTGIRTLVKEWTGKYADWNTIERIFSHITGKNFRWFFQQWVERTGSPSLSLTQTEVQADTEHPGQFLVNVTIVQEGPFYRLRLPAVLHLADGTQFDTVISLNSHVQTVSLSAPSRPTQLDIDPDFMVLRRMSRDQMPPMLNTWVTAQNQSVQIDETNSAEIQKAYQPILHRLRSQGSAILPGTETNVRLPLQESSFLILGNPLKSDLAQQGLAGCDDEVQVGDNWISIQGEKFEGPDIAWLVTCPNPSDPAHVMSVFHGFSPSAISRVARLLFFYGWDSYLVFQDGNVLTRGLFDPPMNNLNVLLNAA